MIEYKAAILSTILIISLLFLGYIFLIKKQNSKLNWSLFYTSLYIIVALPIVNYICIKLDYWSFSSSNSINLPFDLYYLWILVWSILPVYFFKGKYIILVILTLFWLDFMLMPELDNLGLVTLNKNWVLGELLLIAFVLTPSYFWAYCSYYNKLTWVRALFQIVVMGLTFLLALPFIMMKYELIESFSIYSSPYIFQLFFIITIPALIAVNDLVIKGKGTPFPFDPTNNIVRTGVYAYCRNPIQWAFTFLFIPLAIYFNSYYLLIGIPISFIYTIGISNPQEFEDMESRFEEKWNQYKLSVPNWRFLWVPKDIPKGIIYFDHNCNQCHKIQQWFLNSKAINLEIKNATDFTKETILQATYIDENGIEFKSISAIASSLEHINLAYASLGWFIRLPIINFILQSIIDSIDLQNRDNKCNY